MIAAPSADFLATVQGFTTGLAADVGATIIDDTGATVVARTDGATEHSTIPGLYLLTLTAPSTEDHYIIDWDDDDGNHAYDDLYVTSDAIDAAGTFYITASSLKQTLNLVGSTFADNDINVAIAAASRCVDGYTSDRFYPTTETRYYTGEACDGSIQIDSLNALTSVAIDFTGDGSYGTAWTNGTHFYLDPINGPSDGYPYTKLVLRSQNGARFPGYANGVKVIGSFGWATVPPAVVQATTILAGRFLKRARETPYGILVVSGDAVAAARLGRIDPDVAFLLDNLPGSVPLLAV